MRPASREGVLAAICIFTPLTLTFVLLRIWAARLRKRPFAIHDYFIFIAEAGSLASDGLEIAAYIHGGMGLHVDEVSLQHAMFMSKVFILAGYTWLVATSAAKFSVLFLIHEIFRASKPLRYGVYVMMTLVGLFSVAMLLSFSLHCRPFALNWNKSLPGHCGDVAGEVQASAAANLGLDVLIFLLPQPMTWRLQMSIKKKLVVSGIFFLGLMLCMINILRISNGAAPGEDYTYVATNDALYALLEGWVSIVVACLAVLQPVFVRIIGTAKAFSNRSRLKGSSERSEDYSTSAFPRKSQLGRGRFRRIEENIELESNPVSGHGCSAIATRVDDIDSGLCIPDERTIAVHRDFEVHLGSARSD